MVRVHSRCRGGSRRIVPLVAIAIAAVLTGPVHGQAPGGAPPFGGGPGGGPRFGGSPGSGFGGGFGGGGMVIGTIRQIDPSRGAVQVQTAGQQGESRWVTVSQQASITRQVQETVADLKPNDTIVVTGIPLTIQASQIQVGDIAATPFGGGPGGGPGGGFGGRPGGGGPGGFGGGGPDGAPGGGRPGGGFGAGGPGGGQGPGGGPNAQGGQGQSTGSNARATGTIVTTKPLVVRLPGNLRLNVSADASTRVTRIVKSSLADLKVGDTLMAMGQPDENGNITAMRVDVGIDPNAGFGGFGFRGGPGGGPGGGFGGGPGGFRQRQDTNGAPRQGT